MQIVLNRLLFCYVQAQFTYSGLRKEPSMDHDDDRTSILLLSPAAADSTALNCLSITMPVVLSTMALPFIIKVVINRINTTCT